jgi:hypothetical protein
MNLVKFFIDYKWTRTLSKVLHEFREAWMRRGPMEKLADFAGVVPLPVHTGPTRKHNCGSVPVKKRKKIK